MGKYVSHAGQCDAYMNRNKTKKNSLSCARPMCLPFKPPFKRACTMNIRKSIRNAQKYGINVYTTLQRMLKRALTHTLVDGGLPNALSRRNRAMRMSVCARPMHTHCTTQHTHQNSVNALCLHAGIKCVMSGVCMKWGLPVPIVRVAVCKHCILCISQN